MQSTLLLGKKHVFPRRRAAWRWQSLSIPLGPSYPLNPGSDNEFPPGPGPGVHLFSPEHERGIAFSSPPAFKIGSWLEFELIINTSNITKFGCHEPLHLFCFQITREKFKNGGLDAYKLQVYSIQSCFKNMAQAWHMWIPHDRACVPCVPSAASGSEDGDESMGEASAAQALTSWIQLGPKGCVETWKLVTQPDVLHNSTTFQHGWISVRVSRP